MKFKADLLIFCYLNGASIKKQKYLVGRGIYVLFLSDVGDLTFWITVGNRNGNDKKFWRKYEYENRWNLLKKIVNCRWNIEITPRSDL